MLHVVQCVCEKSISNYRKHTSAKHHLKFLYISVYEDFLFIIFHSLIYFAVLTYINELRRRIAFT